MCKWAGGEREGGNVDERQSYGHRRAVKDESIAVKESKRDSSKRANEGIGGG